MFRLYSTAENFGAQNELNKIIKTHYRRGIFKLYLFTRAILAENGLFVFKFGVISKECFAQAMYSQLH